MVTKLGETFAKSRLPATWRPTAFRLILVGIRVLARASAPLGGHIREPL